MKQFYFSPDSHVGIESGLCSDIKIEAEAGFLISN